MTKKLILIIAGCILFMTFIIVVTIMLNPSPEPKSIDDTSVSAQSQDNKADALAPSPEQQTSDGEETMHGEGELLDQETTDAAFLNARQAAEAFVAQPMDEVAVDRQERLRPYFTSNSKAVTAKPPVNSDSYFTTKVTALETDWYDLGPQKMGVIVYLNVGVNTGFNEYEEKQSWVLQLVNQHNVWTARSIVKSDMPYIEGVN